MKITFNDAPNVPQPTSHHLLLPSQKSVPTKKSSKGLVKLIKQQNSQFGVSPEKHFRNDGIYFRNVKIVEDNKRKESTDSFMMDLTPGFKTNKLLSHKKAK